MASPPEDGTTYNVNSPAARVKAIHLPSGDQSGSVHWVTPPVRSRVMAPPPAGTVYSAARPLSVEVKQMRLPSGDQLILS